MQCPRCPDVLRTVQVEEMEIWHCATCGGIWLDFAQFERILSRDYRALHHLSSYGLPVSSQTDKPMICPRPKCDSAPLLRMRGEGDPVVYYACLSCYGHWLDATELKRLASLPLAAKLEKVFRELLE